MNNLIDKQDKYDNKIYLVPLIALVLLLLSTTKQANAALIITDINHYNANGESFVDVNNDMVNDLLINVYKDDQEDSAIVWSTTSIESEYNIDFQSNRLNFAMSTSFDAKRFAVGDVVNSSWGTWYDYGQIYMDYYYQPRDSIVKEGEWQNIGDVGFLGFSFQEDDGTHYGWMELTRGSVSISRIAYQSIAGHGASIMGAPTTSVPEPTTQMLLLSGVMFIALRRKYRLKQ